MNHALWPSVIKKLISSMSKRKKIGAWCFPRLVIVKDQEF
jgi:hypothetical protein